MKKISILLVTLLLILTGCSGSGSGDAGNANGTASGGGEAKSQDLIVALGAEPVKLDPQDATDNNSYHVLELLYDKLVTFDKDMNIVPALAKEWTPSEDGSQMTFTLRDDAKFQDGTPVNAEAVKASFDRILNKENKLARYSMFAEFVDSVSVKSEYEVTFQFKFPFGAALATLAHPSGSIVNVKATEGNKITKSPIGAGSGPYQFKEWISGEKLVLEANHDYWGDKPKLQTITFKPVVENSARSLMLETGEADVILPVPATDFERLKGSDKVIVESYPTTRNLYIGIQTQKEPFTDIRVRQALNYAVDKETIVNKILMGQGKVADSAITQYTWGHSPVGTYPYDPEKAKQLLAEAGVKPGTTIKLWTPEGRYLMDRQIAEFVQGNLQAVGFNVEFRKWEWGAYQDAYKNPESGYDLVLVGWGASTGDADWGLRPTFKTKGSSNYSLISSPEIDALIDKGMRTVNLRERQQTYQEALTLIKEQAPWIFLLELNQTVGIQKNVQGVVHLTTELLDLRRAEKQ